MNLVENHMHSIEHQGKVVVERWRPYTRDFERFSKEIKQLTKGKDFMLMACSGTIYTDVDVFLRDERVHLESAIENRNESV